MGASGTTTLDFGAFPGAVEATVDVAAQSGLVSTSEIEAWVEPIATADHTVDEHIIENLVVMAFYKADGSLTIRGWTQPAPQFRQVTDEGSGNERHRLWGQFTVGWVWA